MVRKKSILRSLWEAATPRLVVSAAAVAFMSAQVSNVHKYPVKRQNAMKGIAAAKADNIQRVRTDILRNMQAMQRYVQKAVKLSAESPLSGELCEAFSDMDARLEETVRSMNMALDLEALYGDLKSGQISEQRGLTIALQHEIGSGLVAINTHCKQKTQQGTKPPRHVIS